MSWSLQIQTEPNEHDKAYDVEYPANVHDDAWMTEQVHEAVAAAVWLIESGKVGDPRRYGFNIQLTGHANTGHDPTPGWVNDFISISVLQRSP